MKSNLISRGVAYSMLGNNNQAIADLKIAARLGFTPAQDFKEAWRIPVEGSA